jgi:hypothetical protein
MSLFVKLLKYLLIFQLKLLNDRYFFRFFHQGLFQIPLKLIDLNLQPNSFSSFDTFKLFITSQSKPQLLINLLQLISFFLVGRNFIIFNFLLN